MRQSRSPLGRTLGGVHVAVHVLDAALGDTGLQQLQAAAHPGEQVVEVVRQPAGELAYRFHLLRLAQGLLRNRKFSLCAQAFGNIPGVVEGAQHPAFFISKGGVDDLPIGLGKIGIAELLGHRIGLAPRARGP